MIARVIHVTRFLIGFAFGMIGFAFASFFIPNIYLRAGKGPDEMFCLGFPFVAWVRNRPPSRDQFNNIGILCDLTICLIICSAFGFFVTRMARKPVRRFETNNRLTLIISAVLFILLWFIPLFGKAYGPVGIRLFSRLFSSPQDFSVNLNRIISCTLMFGLAALCVGWVLQCLVVIVTGALKERKPLVQRTQ